MKSKFKGFTLIELIIVMAILVILMAAIMQMFKPIRETYVDSTLYENQRTTQNGIIKYISESTRYATDLGIYDTGSGSPINNVQDAVDEFAAAYHDKNKTVSVDDVKKNADVIVIDNATSYNGHIGRLLRRKKDSFGNDTLNESSDFRIALGASYYGKNDYAIKVSRPEPNTDPTTGLQGDDLIRANSGDWPASYGIRITVASTAVSGISQLEDDESITDGSGNFNDKDFDPNEDLPEDTTGLITVQGLVSCPNLVKTGGMFDVLDEATRDEIEADVQSAHGEGGDGGGGGIEVTPGSGLGVGNSSNKDGTTINGKASDDTVGNYNPTGGGSLPGVTPPAGYTDEAKYNEDNANKRNHKVYIVFLNN